jgi:hypothetical protein
VFKNEPLHVYTNNIAIRNATILKTSIFKIPVNKLKLKRSFSEITTRFLTPYREFEEHPHTPHRRQLIFKFLSMEFSRVTSTFYVSAHSSMSDMRYHAPERAHSYMRST